MVLLLILNLLWLTDIGAALLPTTCDRVKSHGYPCEKHTTYTDDNFKLTLFRMNEPGDENRPAIVVFHGLFSSSDSFILAGPGNSITYMLYDAGYDVWLGNFRGNDYSQEGILIWDFCWHEMGIYDMPSMIDYILDTSGQTKLHLVAHSQGGTTFFVMGSMKHEYFEKLKTIHLLAPAVYMLDVQSPIAKLLSPLAALPSAAMSLIGNTKFFPGMDVINYIAPTICALEPAQEWCKNMLFLFAGGPSNNTNNTILKSIFETHPTDCSLRQLLHYGQGMISKQFLLYDFGPLTNTIKYGTRETEEYPLQLIPVTPAIHVYGGPNDDLVSVAGLKHLANTVPNVVLEFLPIVDFNHLDFVFAYDLGETLNSCIVDRMNEYEGKPFRNYTCKFN